MSDNITISIEQDKHKLASNSIWAIAGTFLSRISGIFRTLIVNATFGATTTLDVFNAAFRFPNSLRDLFADGALSAAFVKALVDIEKQGDDATRELISITSGFFLTVTVFLAILGVIFAKPFMNFVSGSQFAMRGGLESATILFQILVFYLPITMLNSIAMGVLGVKGNMFRAMNGSIFLSVGMIAGALIFAPIFLYLHDDAIMGLAVGAMLGVILQFIYQVYPLKNWNLLVLPNFNMKTWWRYKPLKEILLMMTPRALGQGALVLALMINTFFAIQVGQGALTYVTTTVIIIQVPIGLFGVATGFAALPLLSAAFNDSHISRFQYLLKQSFATTNWLSIFTIICITLFIVPLYMLLFQHGKITFHDTIQNSIAICAYGIGIFFAANGKVLLNTLYAVNATRQIVINAIIYLIVNITLSAILAPRFGLIGLGISFATATATDAWLNYWVIHRHVKKKFPQDNLKLNTKNFILWTVLSYLIGLMGVILCRDFWSNFLDITSLPLTNLTALFIIIPGGLITLMVFLLISRFRGPEQLQKLCRKIIG